MHTILVINPGSTSTKVALFEDEKEVWKESIHYTKEQLAPFEKIMDQAGMRSNDIERVITEKGVDLNKLSAVVGRGGPFKSLSSGTYKVGDTLLEDIRCRRVQADHISNIGAPIAYALAQKAGVSAYFVDPVSVDEFEPVARISGIPELERKSLLHALNVKATAHRYAAETENKLSDCNLIVAHLGGGISICPLMKGRIVDVNNANDGGPFSPERAGTLPVTGLIKLCFSGEHTQDALKKRIVGNGGLSAYLGTNDMQDICDRIKNGDDKADLVLNAMVYQISKEIGAMATVLKGEVDAILLTGGVSHRPVVVDRITERVSFIAPVHVYPGENEMEALALGALRVLNGDEESKQY